MLTTGKERWHWGPAVLCGAVYLLLFGVLASVLRTHFGFPLDDSWIHQVIARNLVEYHALGFTPGRVTSGSTSLLWTVVLSGGMVVLPGVSPVVFCAGLSGLTLFGTGFVLKRMTEEDGVPATTSWCLALAPALSGNFLWFGLLGMEHLLFLLLSLGLVWRWFGTGRGGTDAVGLFVLGLTLELTRPEGIFLILLLAVAGRGEGRTLRRWGWAAAGGLCGLATVAAFNWRTSGTPLPPTMAARGLFAGPRDSYLIRTWLQFLRTWTFYGPGAHLAGHPLLVLLPLMAVSMILIAAGVGELRSLRARRFLFLSLWGVLVELLYFVELPSPGHGGRYIVAPLMVCFSLLMVGVSCALRGLLGGGRGYGMALGAVMAVWAVDSGWQWRGAAIAGIDQINSEHGGTAEWMAANLPAGEFASFRVGVFDIGRIGYRFGGRVVDLGGLVDASYLRAFRERRTAEYLARRGVEYVVIPGNAEEGDRVLEEELSLDRGHGVTLRLVHVVCAEAGAARTAKLSTAPAFPCQRLYRIGYGSGSAGADVRGLAAVE